MNDHEPLVFPDETSALSEETRWINLLPARPSVYQPSGKLSHSGWLVFPTAGLAAGVIGAILAGTLVAYVGGYITFLSLNLEWFADLPFLISALFTTIVFCMGAGSFCAAGVGIVSHTIKNRNTVAEGAVSLSASGIGAFLLCYWVLPVAASHLLPILPSAPEGSFLEKGAGIHPANVVLAHKALEALQEKDSTALLMTFLLVVIGIAIMSLKVSVTEIKNAKFCEPCERYMKSRQLPFLSLESAVSFVDAIKNADVLKDSLPGAISRGPAKITLSQCDACNAGYLELLLTFAAKWPASTTGKTKTNKAGKMSKTWLVASIPVSSNQSAEIERRFGTDTTSP